MNVLILTRLFAPHIGGVEKHILETNRILKRVNDITIVTQKYKKDLQDSQILKGQKYSLPQKCEYRDTK
jgi:methyl coenzyme M reductase subunit C